jgi:hypothetical protein
MAITAQNPRRARLIATLAGIALGILGGIVWLIGDDNKVQGSNSMVVNSVATWGDLLDYSTDQDDDLAAAQDQYDRGETQTTFGIAFTVIGLAVVGARWLIKAAPAAAKAPAAATLTPEQEKQAIAMYLEARQRQQNTTEQ